MLDLTAAVFVLFVCGEKLLLNHKMNKPLPWYVVLSLYSPSASKLSSKSLICPQLRPRQMFTFRTISQPRACITQYNIPRKMFIHKISYHISYHIISYHIISYHIISYHFISYHPYNHMHTIYTCDTIAYHPRYNPY